MNIKTIFSTMVITSLLVLGLGIPFIFDFNSYADSNKPHGHPDTLKEQLVDRQLGDKIICPNPDHTLVLRPNNNWACIYPESAQNLKWDRVKFSVDGFPHITTAVPYNNEYYDITYQTTEGVVDSISYLLDFPALQIKLSPTQIGKLTLLFSIGEDTLFEDYCGKTGGIEDSERFMIITHDEIGFEEYTFDSGLTEITFQYEVNDKEAKIIYYCLA